MGEKHITAGNKAAGQGDKRGMLEIATPVETAAAPIRVVQEVCRDFARSSKLEWLETNGTGAFAMGTVSGVNTRRYHGLLVASMHPPVERRVRLARVEEELEGVNLGACQYPGTVTPAGFQYLVSFTPDPFPTWRYALNGIELEKRLFLVPARQVAVLRYFANRPCQLRLRPFLADRDYHSLQHRNSAPPELQIQCSGHDFSADGFWYSNVEYLEELDRGLDFREDLFSPGTYRFALTPAEPAWLVATTESISEETPFDGALVEEMESAVRARRPLTGPDPLTARLRRAADQFLVARQDGLPTVIAGYPWFTDWGRDTMISLPGLLLAQGKLHEAEEILTCFLQHRRQGLIPNRFPDTGGAPEYNTADGTLWMFQAMWAYLQAGGSEAFLRDVFYPAARQIIVWHQRGTLYAIGVDPEDGLLAAGEPGSQLTWMDAKVGDWVVTPRHGKPVEINALWYNALRMTAQWAAKFGDLAFSSECDAAAARTASSFASRFWNGSRNCLFDVLTPHGPDERIRPNQVFAVSLPFPLLDTAQQRAVVDCVEKFLLTPFGLRTLEPGHPDYRGRYQGGPLERDGAYHQGTVWPWLLGPFISAYLRVHGRTRATLARARDLLRPLEAELQSGCLGTLAEVYDGDPPHLPGGTPAQAWSIAEILRILENELD